MTPLPESVPGPMPPRPQPDSSPWGTQSNNVVAPQQPRARATRPRAPLPCWVWRDTEGPGQGRAGGKGPSGTPLSPSPRPGLGSRPPNGDRMRRRQVDNAPQTLDPITSLATTIISATFMWHPLYTRLCVKGCASPNPEAAASSGRLHSEDGGGGHRRARSPAPSPTARQPRAQS